MASDSETCGWARGDWCHAQGRRVDEPSCYYCRSFGQYYVKRLKLEGQVRKPLKVYLAGGFHTDWQEQVRRACEERAPGCFVILNPKKSWDGTVRETEEKKEADDKALGRSPWWPADKFAVVKSADIVFFNIEAYINPAKLRGTGDIFEAGMCYAADKLVVYVNQVDHRYYRGIARLFQINEATLEAGIDALIKLAWLAPETE